VRVAEMRDGIYQLVSQLKYIEDLKGPSKEEVRILSAVALGLGTMFG
jgi:hypothetical protein